MSSRKGFKVTVEGLAIDVKCKKCFDISADGEWHRPRATFTNDMASVDKWIEDHVHSDYRDWESAMRAAWELQHASGWVLDEAFAEVLRASNRIQVDEVEELGETLLRTEACFICKTRFDLRAEIKNSPSNAGVLATVVCVNHEHSQAVPMTIMGYTIPIPEVR